MATYRLDGVAGKSVAPLKALLDVEFGSSVAENLFPVC